MQAKDFNLAEGRFERPLGDSRRDCIGDRPEWFEEVLGSDARGMRRPRKQPGLHVVLRCVGQVGCEERKDQAIGLVWVALLDLDGMGRQGWAASQPILERGRQRRPTRAQADPAREILKGAPVIFHSQPAVQVKRLGGHCRGYIWVSIPVAPDPRSQPEPGVVRPEARVVFVQGGFQAFVDFWKRVPEDLTDKIQRCFHLIGWAGLGRPRPVGQPEGGDLIAKLAPGAVHLSGEPVRQAESPQALSDPLDLRKDGPAAGFGRVSGQDELDLQPGDQAGHLIGRHAAGPHLGDCFFD